MRIRWIFAVAAAMIAAFPSNAQAGEGWRVVDTAGVVRVGGPGLMPVALTREQELPADAWIETASGRAILVRGQESVVVEPNSRIQLPGNPINGNTQVLQNLGSAIYKIGKQQKPHFQVDTPYMAAVVKGTAFTVTVGAGEASVAVTEGLVQVSTPGQEDIEFVRPGFTALVSRENGGEISIDRTHAGDVPHVPEPPKGEHGNTQAILIPAAIGNVDVDVKEVSSGLVTSDVVPTDVVPVKDVAALVPNTVDAVAEAPAIAPAVDAIAPAVDVAPVIDVLPPVVAPVPDVTNGVGGAVVGDSIDTIRGQGNGLALGVGNGLALGHLKHGD
jgi:hypothetical protein